MKRSTIPLSLILASAFVAPSIGCVDAADTIVILKNQQPGTDCVVTATESAPFFSRGQIDVVDPSQLTGYLFTPVIQNLAAFNEGTNTYFFIEGANVDLEFTKDFFSEAEVEQFKTEGNSRFVQEFSGSVAPGAVEVLNFEIVPAAMLTALAAKLQPGDTTRVVAKVEVIGELGGGDTSSQKFSYPIDVCNGCLSNNLGSCDELALDITVRPGGSCQPLQDGNVDCCTADGSLVCPAISTVIPPEL